jgi:hypothetical protein
MPSNTYDKPWLIETITMPSELISNHIITGNWSLYFNDVSLFDEKWTTIVKEFKNNNLPDVYEIKCSTNYVHPQMKEKISFRMVVFKCCFSLIKNNIELDKDNIENRMMVIGTNILNVLNYTDRTTIYSTLNGDTSLKSSIPTSRNHTFELINHLHAGYRREIYSLDDDHK